MQTTVKKLACAPVLWCEDVIDARCDEAALPNSMFLQRWYATTWDIAERLDLVSDQINRRLQSRWRVGVTR
jgi:hypothetical protein